MTIVPTAPVVSQELATFSGAWVGTWDSMRPHVLVVEAIEPPHALVVYAWGVAPQRQLPKPGWTRLRGEFVEGTLHATYAWHGGRSQATLIRVQE
jgi:hypothetical protein